MRYCYGFFIFLMVAGCGDGGNQVIDNSNREKPSAASVEEFNAAMSATEPME